nr:PREDICTED: uncharacterized protein LOC102362747 [Latimeria chalumnae]|eukprot:XP_006013731.1 PREDICTED: uncharacterized protein LOC102362747 [Latimeria chalumnae]
MGKAEKRTPSPEQNSKQQKILPGIPPAAEKSDMASPIADILREIGELNSSMQEPVLNMDKDVSQIKQNLIDMEKDFKEIRNRIGEAEQRISTLENNLAEVCTQTRHTGRMKEALWEKVIDIEGWSRCSNLRVFGVKEGFEKGQRDLLPLTQEMLQDIMPTESTWIIELERTHRALAPKLLEGQHPRVIIVKFLHFRDKEKVLEFARERKTIQWREMDLEIYPDHPWEVVEERRKFIDVRHLCREKGFRTGFRFPAILHVTAAGESKNFEDAKEAKKFMQSKILND